MCDRICQELENNLADLGKQIADILRICRYFKTGVLQDANFTFTTPGDSPIFIEKRAQLYLY